MFCWIITTKDEEGRLGRELDDAETAVIMESTYIMHLTYFGTIPHGTLDVEDCNNVYGMWK